MGFSMNKIRFFVFFSLFELHICEMLSIPGQEAVR